MCATRTRDNNSLMSNSEKVAMSCYDRVAIGGELLLFDHPGARPPGVPTEGGDGEETAPVPPTAEFAVEELQAALRHKGKQAQEVRQGADRAGGAGTGRVRYTAFCMISASTRFGVVEVQRPNSCHRTMLCALPYGSRYVR